MSSDCPFLCCRLLLRGLSSFPLCLLNNDLLPDEPLTELAEEVVEDDGAGDDANQYDDDDDGSVHCRPRVLCWWDAVKLLGFVMFGEECSIGIFERRQGCWNGCCLGIAR